MVVGVLRERVRQRPLVGADDGLVPALAAGLALEQAAHRDDVERLGLLLTDRLSVPADHDVGGRVGQIALVDQREHQRQAGRDRDARRYPSAPLHRIRPGARRIQPGCGHGVAAADERAGVETDLAQEIAVPVLEPHDQLLRETSLWHEQQQGELGQPAGGVRSDRVRKRVGFVPQLRPSALDTFTVLRSAERRRLGPVVERRAQNAPVAVELLPTGETSQRRIPRLLRVGCREIAERHAVREQPYRILEHRSVARQDALAEGCGLAGVPVLQG